MNALIIAHDHLSDAGLLRAPLESAGFTLRPMQIVSRDRFEHPDVSVVFPEPTGFDLIVALGAPWSAYDSARLGRWVSDERAFLRAADEAGVPVLGVCFGGQQLAAAHGGSVARASEPEIGWFPIVTEATDLVSTGPWFEWHFDHWVGPPTAQPLARTDRAQQAFRLRRNLAVQFHPEVDEKLVLGWLDNGAAAAARQHGLDPDELLARTRAEQDAAAARAGALIEAFLAQVAS